MMPTRCAILILDSMFLVFLVYILSLGHDYKKGPMKKGFRRSIIMFFYNICCNFYAITAGVHSSKVTVDFDYSYYLGPNYKQE